MDLNDFSALMLPAVEKELQKGCQSPLSDPTQTGLKDMLSYHLGWQGEGAGKKAQGKRIRALMCLLSAGSCGTPWQDALPGAAAIELIHNFSLIHDDIEDRSEQRHSRPTVWKQWGEAQAINAGDTMFTLAFHHLTTATKNDFYDIAPSALSLLVETCIRLTSGQYLDLYYENLSTLNIADYWTMVGGKTAALLAASAQMGALFARANETVQVDFYQFGFNLGLAFQAQDDYLGIWGDCALTGKSTENDLLAGKKSLPVVYALAHDPVFTDRWKSGELHPDELLAVTAQLEKDGAKDFTLQQVEEFTTLSLSCLDRLNLTNAEGRALHELAQKLIHRAV
ncbi:MAG TPA: polyprenyl synthetase family protein [Longilinea sp.]|nr:polyprenyl synthetase family protein [Longilinea sp.]